MSLRAPQFGKRSERRDDPLDGFTIPVDRSGSVPPKAEASPKPAWRPPEGVQTFASIGIAEARTLVGRDAILREDPYFGRRGRIKEVVPDPEYGFLVLLIIYKRDRTPGIGWEVLDKPGALGRAYWPPGKVEFV